MTKTNMKKMVGLAALLALMGGVALAEPVHTSDQNALMASLYDQMDASRERTMTIVLAKAETAIVRRLAMRDNLPIAQPNLNRFVLAHLEP